MSDYYRSDEKRLAELPLFGSFAKSLSVAVQPVQQMKDTARDFHASRQAQQHALTTLRNGSGLTKLAYEQLFGDGRRLAPAIEQLRNAHGFSIDGHGTGKKPYKLCDVSQRPMLAMVTPDMKAIYYTLPHWQRVKQERQSRDSHRCVLCMSGSELRCHHVSYTKLFNEPLEDLMTLCDRCHGRVHGDCRLKFPSGVSVQYAHWLGWKEFETWLLP
jgi:hypothetical protein